MQSFCWAFRVNGTNKMLNEYLAKCTSVCFRWVNSTSCIWICMHLYCLQETKKVRWNRYLRSGCLYFATLSIWKKGETILTYMNHVNSITQRKLNIWVTFLTSVVTAFRRRFCTSAMTTGPMTTVGSNTSWSVVLFILSSFFWWAFWFFFNFRCFISAVTRIISSITRFFLWFFFKLGSPFFFLRCPSFFFFTSLIFLFYFHFLLNFFYCCSVILFFFLYFFILHIFASVKTVTCIKAISKNIKYCNFRKPRMLTTIVSRQIQFCHYIYRPQRSCGQGNIFTPVCHSVHRGACLRQTPPEQTPTGSDTPPGQTPPGTKYTPQD